MVLGTKYLRKCVLSDSWVRIDPLGELGLFPVSDGSLGRCLIEKGKIWQAEWLLQRTPAQEWDLGRCFLYQPCGRLKYMEIRKPRHGQSYSRSEEILLQAKGHGFYFSVYNGNGIIVYTFRASQLDLCGWKYIDLLNQSPFCSTRL